MKSLHLARALLKLGDRFPDKFCRQARDEWLWCFSWPRELLWPLASVTGVATMAERRSRFAQELDAALTAAQQQPDSRGIRLTQKEISKQIVAEETVRMRLPGQLGATGNVAPEEQRVMHWEEQLSSWRQGDAVPASQEILVLGITQVAPGTHMSSWLALWREAVAQAHEIRTGTQGRSAQDRPPPEREDQELSPRARLATSLNQAGRDINIHGGQYVSHGAQTVVHGTQNIVHGGQTVIHQDSVRRNIMHGDHVAHVAPPPQEAAEEGNDEPAEDELFGQADR
jgi:hypothetical protein